VSDFLGNLARRGAGLAPGVAPRPPAWPSSARRLKNTDAPFSEAPLEGDDAPARRANSDMAAARRARPDADLPQAAPRTVLAPAQLEPRSAPAADPGAHARAPMAAPSLGLAPPFSASARLRFSQAVLRPVPASEWPASESKRSDAVPAMAPRIPDREPRDAAAIVAPAARAAPVRGHADSGPTMARASAMPPERQLAHARQVPADSIPRHQRGPGAPSTSTAAPETPSIHVRIGRIEVRAAPQAAAPARPAAAKGSSGFAELRLARAHLDRTWR
jgi:hypothetical protein